MATQENPSFRGRASHALNLGTWTFGVAQPSSTVIVRIGDDRLTSIEIRSEVDTNDEISWNGTSLTVSLTQETVEALRVGENEYQITIVTQLGTPLAGPEGQIKIKSALPAAA